MSGAVVSEPPVTVEELRTVDLFEDLSDEQLAEWVAVAHTYRVPAGEIIAEQGEETRGLLLLLQGDAQATIDDRTGGSEPIGRQKAPTWIGAIATLTGGTLGARMRAETDCRMAVIEADDFRRLAFAQPAIHGRVMQAGRAGDEPRHQHRAEPRAADLARHDGRGPGARAQQPRRRSAPCGRADNRGAGRHQLGDRALRRGRRRARAGRSGSSPCSSRRSPTPPPARRSTRSTRPTPRTICWRAWKRWASRSPGSWPSRWPSPGSTRRGWIRSPRRPARRPTRRCAGSPPRSPRYASPPSSKSRPSACRASSARSSPTPTWTAATSSRSTCTRAWRRRSPCSATSSSTPRSRSCATTTARCRS